MSKQYPGGIIVANPTAPSGPYENSTAPGIWTIDQAANYIKQGIWPTAGNQAPDAQFNYVTMLLHGDGTNGAQNNTFLDSSASPNTITRNGNTTQGSFSPYGSNWSNYFNASATSYLSIPSSSAFAFGTGDFTVEFWVNYASASTGYVLYDGRGTTLTQTGFTIYTTSGTLYAQQGVSAIVTATAPTANTWHHIAFSRSGSSNKLFVDGVQVGSTATDSTNYATGYSVGIGAPLDPGYTATYALSGYMSNVRVVKGTAVYTSNFTPSTTPLTAISGTSLLTCQSNRFVDNSASPLTITVGGTPSVQRFNPFGTSTAYSTATFGGSAYFDGDVDYLEASNASFATGTGDFTVEMWVYYIGNYGIAGSSTALTSSPPYGIGIDGTTAWVGTGSFADGISGPLKANAWSYIAFVRSGSSLSYYINGVRVGTTTTSKSVDTTTFRIGDAYNNYTGFCGNEYISNFRFSNSARYSGATMTIPTGAFSSDANTLLLCNFTNGAIYDNAMMNDLETVGNAQISTSVKKYGTGSLAFDGTGDYLSTAYKPTVLFGAGDFTIEFWIYFNSVASGQQPIAGYGGSVLNWAFYLPSSGTFSYYLSSNGTSWNIASGVSIGSVSTGQWYHVALVRSGSTFTPYLNGVAGTTATSSSAIYDNSEGVYVGAIPTGYGVNGYIDDLRITKGYARYTTTFTPPTQAFPNTGPN